MKIQSVRIRNFRNIQDIHIDLGEQANVLVGQNGQGKTSFIEAICLVSQGLSFRPSKWEHYVKHGSERARVQLDFESFSSDQTATLEISEDHRESQLNQKRVSRSLLLSRLPLILFSPESLQIIKEGPEARRSLWDQIAVSFFPTESKLLLDYSKILKTKMRLLKDRREGVISPSDAKAVLDSLQPIFLKTAADLTWLRMRAILEVLPLFQETLRKVMNKSDVDISVDYVISDTLVTHWDKCQILQKMADRALQLASQEWDSGQCLVGPHKHDISFVYCGNDSRFFCSQGQQRAILLSLKIAQALVQSQLSGNQAVLLLDDVLSELDAERRNFLVKFLSETSAQTIVTTTDLAFCKSLRSSNLVEFEVRGGVFQSVDTECFSESGLRRGFDQSP